MNVTKNNIYYSNNNWIDFDNLELLYLYIDKYRQFQNCGINLNAKYSFEYKNCTLKISDSNCISLYPNNINLKILCGKNGVGKTTIINILRDIDNCKDVFIVYKTANGDFVTNRKGLKIIYKGKKVCCSNAGVSRLAQYMHLVEGRELVDIRDENYQAAFCKGYLSHYKELNKVLGKNYRRFFNYFNIGFDNVKFNADDLESSIQIKYNIPLNTIEGLGSYFIKNPIKFIMLNESFDSYFERLHKKIKSKILPSDNKDIPKLFDKILINIYGKAGFNQINKINEEIIDLIYDTSEYNLKRKSVLKKTKSVEDVLAFSMVENSKYQKRKEYYSGYYNNYYEKLENYSNRLNKICNKPINVNLDINLMHYFYINLFKKVDNEEIHFCNLSTGEKHRFITILNLYYKIVSANDLAQTLILEDDIDANLHPEWSRQYIDMYITAINAFSKNKKKIKNVILTTHSPFVLSDTTNDYIEYLEKDGNHTILRKKASISNTFAGNIMQMFEDNMFLDASIGEYSIKILKEVVSYLNNEKLTKPSLLKSNLSKSTKDKICADIINSIGDKVLKTLLTNKYFKKDDHAEIRYCPN